MTKQTTKWDKAQEFEEDWHKHQQFNTYNEETKQYIYASKMGLDVYSTNYYGQRGWDFGDESILDIGGGDTSILLKSKAKKRVVLDPLLDKLPEWVTLRYKEAGIIVLPIKAEDITDKELFDQTILYNVLQHTENPQRIIENIKKISKLIRVFEWVDTPISEGHIHTLTEENLNKWLGGEGKVEKLNESGAVGLSYYGIFPTPLYKV